MEPSPPRRRFLKGAGALTAITGASQGLTPAVAQSPAATHAAQRQVYSYLTQPEIAFVEAAVARLIPADDLGPGAKEAGVAYFIDQQLAGAWGTMGRQYRSGPWPEGTPQQGYQSRLTPQELYRAAIADTDQHCEAKHGKVFAQLTAAQQDEVLRDLDEGKIELGSVPARLFFSLLLTNTREGFFADPIYGGNRDKIGWKLVGFPGVAAVYTDFIEQHNVPYRAQPVSIADIERQAAQVDAHGHPKHVLLGRGD